MNQFVNPASEFVYIRTYSRWIETAKRRETWEETVARYINFITSEREIPEKVIKKIKDKILNFEVMPSMRAMWASGEAARKENITLYNCSFLVLDSPTAFAEMFYILMCGAGVGYSVQNDYISKLPSIPQIFIDKKEVFSIEDSRESWADSVKILIQAMYQGKDIDFDYSKIRPKGSRLITMGGRASGPAPLITLHQYIREVFSAAQGRKLTSLECSDIANQIADSVVVGGVRRSSEISLSDLDDNLMRNAKNWPFPPRRFMSNNSAVYDKKPSAVDFLKEWSALALSGTGERGIFNLEGAKRSTKRRKTDLIAGTNPCVTGDTEILTSSGYQNIDSLVDKEIDIWNGFEWSKVTPKITGENQKILKIMFSDGRILKCTPYHKFHLSKGYKGDKIIVEAKDLTIGDKLIKHSFPVMEGGKELPHAYTQGFISAEGQDDYNFFWVYEPKYACLVKLEGKPQKEYRKRKAVKFDFTPFPKSFIPFDYNLKSKLEWVAGLLDGDGCELKEGGVQLASVDKEFIYGFQKLLSTLGIQSKITLAAKAGMRLMPDGHGGAKDFYCQESLRICIGAVQMQELKSLGLRCVRLKLEKEPQRDASQFVKVVGIEDAGIAEKVYCFNEPKRHLGLFNGVITGQCGEILLRDKQFCNLSEVIVRSDDDLDSLLDKVETATWIGVIQSSFTNFPYLSKKWKRNCDEERLLGVSLTGQMDNPELLTSDALRLLKSRAIKIAKHAAEKMNINASVAVTCVKPSGTVSQLVDSSSGIHPRYAKYYIRRYRISSTDPLFRLIKDQGIGISPENGQEKLSEKDVSTWVVSFPIKSPSNSITRNDLSAIEQLEWYKKIQTNWCEHNASMTVYVKDSEWLEVGNWVYKNWDVINGVSFLPHDGGHYKQAPYEEITKEEYDKLVDNFKLIDYSKLSNYELEDNTEGAKMFNCTGDRCEIV